MRICDVLALRSMSSHGPCSSWEQGAESFFSLTDWFELVARFESDDSTRTFFAIDDQDKAALPFIQVKATGDLRSCTSTYTCEFDAVGNSCNQQEIRSLAREISATLRPAYIRLEALDPGRPSFSALREGFRECGYIVKPYAGWGNWYEKVDGDTFETYLARRPSILKNTWRRKLASANKASQIEFREFRCAGDVDAYITAYEAVQQASWKSAEPLPGFIPDVIRLAAKKEALRMGVLNIHGRPAAAQFWIVWNRKALIFKLVYAEQFAGFSPGTLLTMHMIREILETDKPEEIDFGRGDDRYKRLWVGSRRERWGLEAANPRSPRGLVHATRLSAGWFRGFLRGRTLGTEVKPLKRLGFSAQWH